MLLTISMGSTVSTDYYIAITCVYAKPACTSMKHMEKYACSCKPECTSVILANKDTQCAVHVNHDAYSNRLTCYVYACALKVYFYIIDLSCMS